MIAFPPARYPSGSALRFESYAPYRAPGVVERGGCSMQRADIAMYSAGLGALVGRPLMTSGGAMLQVLDRSVKEGCWAATWFEWDGKRRRIHAAGDDAGRERLMAALSDAWPYGRGEGDALYDEAGTHLARALAYRPMDDVEIIAMNFGLLVSNAGRIASTPCLRDGATGGLSLVFTYMGRIRYPVSTLLAAWRGGRMRVSCPGGRGDHEAFVIRGGGGLGMGVIEAYCPVCGSVKRIEASVAPFLKAMTEAEVRGDDGYRLDELILELGGTLPVVPDHAKTCNHTAVGVERIVPEIAR
ncbi:MAG: hypothetical protein CVV47_07700 [Spirochaetae bacterium HGW-Spirochaetae-3]|jgi:hypothetical protein|nr:MAG: hypothetical protein CVV47_07700 [Spirochaetae bacterium HGW-Spirochaetae-3]